MAERDGPRTKVGYVRRAHGIKGDVLVRPLTDAPSERYEVGAALQTDETPPRDLVIRAVRPHNDGLLITFDEVADRNGAEAMRGVSFTIALSDRRPLDADEFWEEDLLGLDAIL